MSYGRNRRNKERRRKLWAKWPELKIVWRFIRFRGLPRYVLAADPEGRFRKRTVRGQATKLERKGGRRVYIDGGWRLKSFFGLEAYKAWKNRQKKEVQDAPSGSVGKV